MAAAATLVAVAGLGVTAIVRGGLALRNGGPPAWHVRPPASLSEPSSSEPAGSVTGRAAGSSLSSADRGTPAGAAAGPARVIRGIAAAAGETRRAGTVHVILRRVATPPGPTRLEAGPAPLKPPVRVMCGTCRGNVLEINF